jgi:hypothetical protein
VDALGTVFRAKFLEALCHSRETLVLAEQTSLLASTKDFQRFYAKRSMAGPQQVLDYLGRYTHRVAIANHRIVEVHDAQVRFSYRNRRQGNRLETITLPAHEFIRHFLLPVVPHGFQRLRHIGFLANRCKTRALRQCRHLFNHPEPPRPHKKTVTEWMWQLTGTDVTRGPHCGHGPLQRIPLVPLTTRSIGSHREPGVSPNAAQFNNVLSAGLRPTDKTLFVRLLQIRSVLSLLGRGPCAHLTWTCSGSILAFHGLSVSSRWPSAGCLVVNKSQYFVVISSVISSDIGYRDVFVAQ